MDFGEDVTSLPDEFPLISLVKAMKKWGSSLNITREAIFQTFFSFLIGGGTRANGRGYITSR